MFKLCVNILIYISVKFQVVSVLELQIFDTMESCVGETRPGSPVDCRPVVVPPTGKINQSRKIAVTVEPIKGRLKN